jgi:hypothetical protein
MPFYQLRFIVETFFCFATPRRAFRVLRFVALESRLSSTIQRLNRIRQMECLILSGSSNLLAGLPHSAERLLG